MENKIEKYKQEALKARKKVLEMINKAQTSHIGSNFSSIDILTVVYDKANLAKGEQKDKDMVIISKGWIAASVYYFLARKGLIPEKDLEDFCVSESKYIGLLEPNVEGVRAAGGSMGFGLPFAVGFAMAKKIKKDKGRIFVLMSDGEMAIGTTWESALIASHQKIDNLLLIIDANGFQATGKVKDVLDIEPLKEKWQAFGWNVYEIDGHNFNQIEQTILDSEKIKEKPSVIIAKTIKGKGVSFMEHNNLFHYKAPSEQEYKKAIEELNKIE